MTNPFVAFGPVGLVLTLGVGVLQAQPPSREERGIEAQPAPPVLKEPRSLAGMNLDFSHRAKLSEVLANLGKQSGIRIILHTSVPGEASTSADLRGMTFQGALDALMLQNDLSCKVMDPATIMVFKNTPQNRQDFETRSIRTFHLSNADVDNLRQTLGTLMPGLRVYGDKRLNAITISGNSSEMAKTQQVVQDMDRARGEVRLQMELVEVSHKAAMAAGLLPGMGMSPNQDASAVSPVTALAKVMQEGGATLLASPDALVVSGETAAVRIGRKFASSPAEAGAANARQASQGDDLGVKVKVKPTLHPNHEITLDLAYEITDPLKTGDARPSISERVLKTTVSLKDGESIVLGGLLEDDLSDSQPGGPRGGKEKRDRLLVVKAVVVRW